MSRSSDPGPCSQSESPPQSGFSATLSDVGRQNFAALIDSQMALSRGLETLRAEITGLALAGVNAAARTATDALSVKTIADATSLPIVLYNIPGRCSVDILPETVLRLAEACRNIVSIKEASGSVERISERHNLRSQRNLFVH